MIARRTMPKPQETTAPADRPAAMPEREEERVYVIDETGHWVLVPPDPRDIFCNPFLNFTEWDSEEDHRAYDKL